MKLTIMPPYLIPYIGYLQPAAAVDGAVPYDDVNFIENNSRPRSGRFDRRKTPGRHVLARF